MEKYLVIWVVKTELEEINGTQLFDFEDHYQAFVDDEDNLKSATEFYEDLLLKDNIYTANVCLVVKSTDY